MKMFCHDHEVTYVVIVFAPQLPADYYYRPLTQLLLADVVFTTPALLLGTPCHHT